MAESVVKGVAQNQELITSIKYSDDKNARITSDKVVSEELLKHITTNFNLYKLYSDNKEFKEYFSAMMFGLVKEIFNRSLGGENHTEKPMS